MQLSGILNRTTSSLSNYSQLVTDAVPLFNSAYSTIGTIAYDPDYGLPPDEDRVDYWDKWNSDITFGRYLLFVKNNANKEIIPFWTGFSSTQDETIYCIWFEKKNPFMQYINKLKSLPHLTIRDSCRELWILMDNQVLAKFCNSCASPGTGSQMLKDFWHSVLKELII